MDEPPNPESSYPWPTQRGAIKRRSGGAPNLAPAICPPNDLHARSEFLRLCVCVCQRRSLRHTVRCGCDMQPCYDESSASEPGIPRPAWVITCFRGTAAAPLPWEWGAFVLHWDVMLDLALAWLLWSQKTKVVSSAVYGVRSTKYQKFPFVIDNSARLRCCGAAALNHGSFPSQALWSSRRCLRGQTNSMINSHRCRIDEIVSPRPAGGSPSLESS